MSVSDADNRNHPVEYALPAHADTSPVIGTDTRPGHEVEAHIALRFRAEGDGTGHLDIQSIRDRHG